MIAPIQPERNDDASGAGEGPYLTPVQRNKIVGMMLNKRNRFPVTKASKAEAVAVTVNNFNDDDGRVRNAAVANLAKMEKMNMDHELARLELVGAYRPNGPGMTTTNQQINIYLPNNGRETQQHLTNGHNGNGRH